MAYHLEDLRKIHNMPWLRKWAFAVYRGDRDTRTRIVGAEGRQHVIMHREGCGYGTADVRDLKPLHGS